MNSTFDLSPSPAPASVRRSACAAIGFSLIELLVVIAIIGVLIAILLPSLNTLRENSYTTRCAANIRGMTAAVLLYVEDNNGRLPIGMIAPKTTTAYPNGWFWASRLANGGYLRSINTLNTASGVGSRGGILYCPKGVMTRTSGAASYPTAFPNMGYFEASDADVLPPNTDVITWYMPTVKVCSNGGRLDRLSSSPFVYYGSDANLVDPEYNRSLQMISSFQNMAMIIECSSPNFDYTFVQDKLPAGTIGPNGQTTFQAPRLAARHGVPTTAGKDADTNIGFFDGHVSKYSSRVFSLGGFDADPTVNFFVQQQQ